MNKLLKRTAFAVVAIPLLLLVTFSSNVLFLPGVVLAVLVGSFFELGWMARGKPSAILHFSGLYFLLLFLSPASGCCSLDNNWQSLLVLGLLALFVEFLLRRRPLSETVPAIATTFFGAFYLGILGGFILMIRQLDLAGGPKGSWHLVVLYVATWAYDTGGYFVGKKWGKNRLAPVISPKKSWEGCGGGLALTALALAGLWGFFPEIRSAYRPLDMAALAVLLSFFGQTGDLVESMIKRSFAVKDSGTVIPGHGGIFDRIDSLLINGPVLYFYIHFFLR